MKETGFVKIDSHAHLTSDELYPNIDAIIKRAHDAGVTKIVNINTDRITFERALEVKKKYPDQIFNTVSTTPHDVEKEGEENFAFFEKAIRTGHVNAIGEVGLDYYYAHSKIEIQKKFLTRYFDLAVDVNLPVVIHCRGDEAFADLFTFPQNIRAVLHCFTGTLAQAMKALERGWYVSISGIATFKKSQVLRDVIKELPLSKLLIETDAPYLAPQSRRGTLNESAFVGEVAEAIAMTKDISLEEVCFATTQNASEFFNI
jgi:TatD DNase family protein